MNGQVIGKTMSHGYAGSFARQPDSIIDSHPLAGDAGIPFGLAVVRDAANAHAVTLPGASSTAAQFLGVAVREVKSATDYLNQNVGQYAPGEAVPVLKRGCVNVKCQKGTAKAGGAVYLRIKENTTYENAVVGGFEAEADAGGGGGAGANTVQLTNCQWKGEADASGIAELRIMTMMNA